jgi:LacI family transcriptional regulator
MGKITIKDIAKMLSVSVSTVSRALADHPDISTETKVRVKELAASFNYLPNLHARYFRKKNTKMIALILPGFNRFFIPDLIAGIQEEINNNGYSLIIFQTGNNGHNEAEIIKYCLSWVVEGVLISLSDNTSSLEHLKMLKDSDIPVVLLDKVLHSDDYPTVTIDDMNAAYTATSAILSKEKKNVLGVFGHENLSITKDRIKGFSTALAHKGVGMSDDNFLLINDITDIQLQLKLKTDKRAYDGLFLMTDELLVHSLNHFLKLKIQIPEELSIVSMSDGTSPYFLSPNISHIFHSGFKVGLTACSLLFSIIEDSSQDIKHLEVATSLVDLGTI